MIAAAAPDNVGANDAVTAIGKAAGKPVEITALARETVHADHRAARPGATPVRERDPMKLIAAHAEHARMHERTLVGRGMTTLNKQIVFGHSAHQRLYLRSLASASVALAL
jgi:hypothetical protein